MNASKTTVKKNHANRYMLKGFSNQFTEVVTARPPGSRPTRRTDPKSTLTIIGRIIAQINTATGMLTLETSHVARVSGTDGTNSPSTTPTTMAMATHSERYRPKTPSASPRWSASAGRQSESAPLSFILSLIAMWPIQTSSVRSSSLPPSYRATE